MPPADTATDSIVLPSEIVANQVLPTLRSMLASELAGRGLTQTEIADHLGVTQAAVSTYVSDQVATEELIRTDPQANETVERIGEGLASGTLDPYEALAALLDLIHHLEDRGPICELHEEAMPALQGTGCDLCVRGVDTDLSREREVLTAVRKAAKRLANTPELADYVPNVGTNIGMALPGATDIVDVAAIPGRIYTIRGRIEVPANPEFGASRHVATALIAALGVDARYRGAVNLGTDATLIEAARARGFEPVEFDPSHDDRHSRLETVFADRGEVSRVIYHRGAFGIEPILYVFGESAIDAVECARTLVQAE